MRLMSGNSYFTIDELAEKLETSYRSIYRYIDTFKEVGFAVEKIHGNVYRLVKMPSPFKDISKLVYFSDEEAKILCGLIENLDSTNTLKHALYKKLAAIYDLTSIKEFTGSKSNAGCVQALGNAMEEKRKVVLKLILECCNLTKDEIVVASTAAKKAGFDFVKTSTGFGKGGATLEEIKLMRKTVGAKMGVKAAGGIRDRKTALAMIRAGANRLGCSCGLALVG